MDSRTTTNAFGSEASPTVLTGSYVAGQPIRLASSYQLGLDVAYAMGAAESGNSIQLKVEVANPLDDDNDGAAKPADTEWYQLVSTSASGGTVTVTKAEYTFSAVAAAEAYDYFHISLPNDSQWVKVSCKETGIAANGGSAYVKLVRSIDNS